MPEGVTIDGRSFAPQLKGQKGNPREWTYCQDRDNENTWVRTQRWNLYRDGRLFDIPNDRLEKSSILIEADTTETSAVRLKLLKLFDNLE